MFFTIYILSFIARSPLDCFQYFIYADIELVNSHQWFYNFELVAKIKVDCTEYQQSRIRDLRIVNCKTYYEQEFEFGVIDKINHWRPLAKITWLHRHN